MRRSREQRRGEPPARSARGVVEAVDAQAEAPGVAAHLVQGEQPDVAVERRVLDPLRHHGARRLLEARDELVVAPAPRAAARCAGGPAAPPTPADRPARPGRSRARRTSGTPAAPRAPPRAPARRAAARAARPRAETSSGPARAWPRRRRPPTAAPRPPARSSAARRPGRRRAPARPPRSRSRSSPRPASRAAPPPARGSSRPRPARPHAHEAARGSRAGRRGRRGGRRGAPATSPSPTSSSSFACVASNTPASSTRTPASSSTSKKRRWRAARAVEVEERRAQRLVAPEPALLARGHVIRDDVDDHLEPCPAERAQRVLAAEVLGDAGRVGDVVPVCRAAPGLEHGREVQVADAELAEVRDECRRLRRSSATGPSCRR